LANEPGAKPHLVASTLAPVKSDAGIMITPTMTLDEVGKDLDVLLARHRHGHPGGDERQVPGALARRPRQPRQDGDLCPQEGVVKDGKRETLEKAPVKALAAPK
jgi:hypothetical protein